MNRNLHYEVIGNPKLGTMVCFPGNKKTRKHGLIKQIQDTFGGQWRVVICTDLGVVADESEYSLYDEATDFVTEIERETPGVGVVLLGINRGARIALKVAQRVPQIVNAVATLGRLIENPRTIKKLSRNMPTDLPQLWMPPLGEGGNFAKVQEFLNIACPEFPAANPWIEPSLARVLAENPPVFNPTVQEQREKGEQIHPSIQLPAGFIEREVQIPVDNPEIPQAQGEMMTRIIARDTSDAPSAVIFLIHGGGYVAGSAKFEDDRAVDMIQDFGEFLSTAHPELQLAAHPQTNIVVTVPEYRLAPEYPHPIGREDTLAALRWVFAEYPDVPVLIYSDSAGAGMAYQVLSHLNHQELTRMAGVIALEPCLDPQMSTPSSYNYFWGPTWNRTVAGAAWEHYRQSDAPVRDIYPPIGAELDPQFPPVLVIVNPADTLRDEGTKWAYRLIDAGVRAQLVSMPGTYHGTLGVVGSKTWELVKRQMRTFAADCLDAYIAAQ